MAMSLVMAASADNALMEPIQANQVAFDTDSSALGIDNRCSACISHKIGDFIGPLTDVKRSIKGFGGAVTFPIKQGTLKWTWCDNEGARHTFKIPR